MLLFTFTVHSQDDYKAIPTKGQTKSKRFFQPDVSSKNKQTKSTLLLETSGRLVFICFLEEIEDTKKTFRNN